MCNYHTLNSIRMREGKALNHFKKGLAFVLSVLLSGGVCFALFLSVNRDAPYSTVGLFVAAASGKLQRGDLNGDGKISIADIV